MKFLYLTTSCLAQLYIYLLSEYVYCMTCVVSVPCCS